MKLLRMPALREKSGHPTSTIYALIAKGLMPKPVTIGDRAVAWPEHEVDAIVAARIAGKSDDEIRELVKRLHKARTAPAGAATDGGRK